MIQLDRVFFLNPDESFLFFAFFLPSFPARPTSVAPEERPTRRRGVDWRRMRRCVIVFFLFFYLRRTETKRW